eukprot:CAMPEP_0175404406 /NCGR_PEP_ID=MMETSP0095-20121207/38522_1 /TAXON_ID=311494 /ORGANISM="Alexandrium monilatum, Strain CCMP3105" /LENGTH=253 /DNA_ID=CAMNT_0016703215 /DNA_START=21 /DNA_END=780 /DNA_ORIENTATION=-
MEPNAPFSAVLLPPPSLPNSCPPLAPLLLLLLLVLPLPPRPSGGVLRHQEFAAVEAALVRLLPLSPPSLSSLLSSWPMVGGTTGGARSARGPWADGGQRTRALALFLLALGADGWQRARRPVRVVVVVVVPRPLGRPQLLGMRVCLVLGLGAAPHAYLVGFRLPARRAQASPGARTGDVTWWLPSATMLWKASPPAAGPSTSVKAISRLVVISLIVGILRTFRRAGRVLSCLLLLRRPWPSCARGTVGVKVAG